MARYELELSDDTVELLFSIGRSMGIPQDVAPPEFLETTISFMADAVDSQMEVAVQEDGHPVSMDEALAAIMNPDISTEFQQPAAATPAAAGDGLLTLEFIKQSGGMNGKTIEDHLMQEAVRVVYTQLDRDEWDTAASETLVDKTYKMLQGQLNGRFIG